MKKKEPIGFMNYERINVNHEKVYGNSIKMSLNMFGIIYLGQLLLLVFVTNGPDIAQTTFLEGCGGGHMSTFTSYIITSEI